MGTVPIVIFRVLPQSRAQGLGELGPPHFPVSRSAWYNPKRKYLYRGVTFLDCTRQVYNLGNGGVPVHHDPVDGIVTNHEK